ncbi:MAG: YeeE/YedE thiosulfate transporter family protein [Candidatus Sedimenticola sp. (ex Thyasira tokunagai)]
MLWAAAFAVLNVVMYLTIQRFWIGGSSFLPLIGEFGPNNAFIFALVVNLGVIIGAFLAARQNGEFILRPIKRENIGRVVLGGLLIGIGVSLAPGTCTTAFVTGMPMLSVASFLSAVGIFVGAYIAFRATWKG